MTNKSWNRAGVSLGILFALLHTTWIVLVGAGISRQVLSAMARAHFIAFQYGVFELDVTIAILGIFGAFVSGYLLGATFTIIWNVTGNYL